VLALPVYLRLGGKIEEGEQFEATIGPLKLTPSSISIPFGVKMIS